MEVLPKSANVDVATAPTVGGLTGVVEALHTLLRAEADQRAPELGDLLCISGVAFKNYVFEPELNAFEEPVGEFSDEAHFVCNYGPFESLAYYTGFDIQEFNGISRDDYWKLLRFEVASGRALVSMGLRGPLQPAIVVGYDESEGSPVVTAHRARSEDAHVVDLSGEVDMQGDSESFVNWMVIARPGDVSDWTPSANRQRLRALRWAEAHARRPKEFGQETRENYAPGLAGFESFQRFLERHDADDFVAGLLDYALTHVEELARGRRAAARELPRWGESLRNDDEFDLDAPDKVVDLFTALAGEYARVSEPLEDWLKDKPDRSGVDAAGLQELRRAHVLASEAERDAVERLEELVSRLPNLF